MDFLYSHILDLKHNVHITDSVGAHILIQEQTVIYLKLFIGKAVNLFTDIRAFQHRNTLKILRSLL